MEKNKSDRAEHDPGKKPLNAVGWFVDPKTNKLIEIIRGKGESPNAAIESTTKKYGYTGKVEKSWE